MAEGPVLERVRRWTRRADPHRDLQEERRQGGRGPVLPVPEAGHSSARPLPGRVELQLQLRRRPLVTVESVCCPYQPSGLRLRHPNPGPHRPVCGRGEERRADGDVRADAAASAEADPKGESAVHRIALHLHLELPVPGGPGPVLLREVLRQRRALQLHQRVDLPELVGFAGGGAERAREAAAGSGGRHDTTKLEARQGARRDREARQDTRRDQEEARQDTRRETRSETRHEKPEG